jgi:hypothetical protein
MKRIEFLYFTVTKNCVSIVDTVKQLSLFGRTAGNVSRSCHFCVEVFLQVIAIRVVHPLSKWKLADERVNVQMSYMKVPKLVLSLHVGRAFLMGPLN